MSVAQHIRACVGGLTRVAPQRSSGGSRHRLRRHIVCTLALVWMPCASAAQSSDEAERGAGSSSASASAQASAAVLGAPDANSSLDFTLPIANGGNWRLAEHRGRVVWLALVAPWCGQCAGFVSDVATRLRGTQVGAGTAQAASAPPAAASVHDAEPSVFMVVSAVDARGHALDVPITKRSTSAARYSDARSAAVADPVKLLIDRDGAVLRTFDPDDLPWLVRIDEDGVLVAAGADLDVLAPARIEPGLWQNLRSRWRQVWGGEE